MSRSTKKRPQIKRKKNFLAAQNRLKNTYFRGIFLICARYTPFDQYCGFSFALVFFHNLYEGSKIFRGNFHPKNDPQKNKIFFFRNQMSLSTIVSVVFFRYVPIISPFKD